MAGPSASSTDHALTEKVAAVGDGAKGPAKGPAKAAAGPPRVPLKQLFRFADRFDVFMFWVCLFFNAAQGAAFPR